MSRTEKEFDAAAIVRLARDRISAEIEGITLEQEFEWLASQKIDAGWQEQIKTCPCHPAPSITDVVDIRNYGYKYRGRANLLVSR